MGEHASYRGRPAERQSQVSPTAWWETENRGLAAIQGALRQARDAYQRHLQNKDPSALGEATTLWKHILHHPNFSRIPEPYRSAALNDAGQAFLRRYQADGRPADLDSAIAYWSEAVQLTLPDSPAMPVYLSNLGLGLHARFTRAGAPADLEEAIRNYSAAIECTPDNSRASSTYLNNLGNALSERYGYTGSFADLESAIKAHRQALQHISVNSPDRPALLNNLGSTLHKRYACTGRMEDLREAIRVLESAVRRTPIDSPERSSYLNNLGIALHTRYARKGATRDLDSAVQSFQEAVRNSPTGAPELPKYLSNMGNELHERYRQRGLIEDLNEAIHAHEQAVEKTPSNAPGLPQYLSNLGSALRERHARDGSLEDLDRAIQVARDAVALTPPGSTALSRHLTNLGNALWDRYVRTGSLEELDEAISFLRKAAAYAPHDFPDRPMYLNNLGLALGSRSTHADSLAVIEEAVQVLEEAVLLTSPGSVGRSKYLSNWGAALHILFTRTHRAELLEKKITALREALSITPITSPERAARLHNLGSGLLARYNDVGCQEDLEEAIDVCDQSARSAPNDSRDRPVFLVTLGDALRSRYALSRQPEDLTEAVRAYSEAVRTGMDRHSEASLAAVRSWGDWALEREAWLEAAEAYNYGMEIIERLHQTQLMWESKLSWLWKAGAIPARAAYALARCNRLEEAVVFLERGRGRLLAEKLALDRTQIEGLRRSHPQLAESYQKAVNRLGALGRSPSPANAPQHIATMDDLQTAQRELNQLVEAIRQVPGYHDFREFMSYSAIATAAQKTTLVFLATSPGGGVALIIHPGGVQVTWLDNLSDTILHERMLGHADQPEPGSYMGAYLHWLDERTEIATQEWLAVLDETTHWLWNVLMGPLGEALSALISTNLQRERTPVVLITQGWLALLPLHAAWTDDPATPTGRRYVLDNICLCYAPNIRAIQPSFELMPGADAEPQGILSVDEPMPVTAARLMSSSWEVSIVSSHFPENRRVLQNENATRDIVLQAIPNYPVLHMCCHGFTDLFQPLFSGLIMAHDQTLTLQDILDLRLRNTRLVVLSACDTGIPGAQAPDEVLCLPAGLVCAGVAGVISTLWSIADVSTAMLMAYFYELWKADGLAPTEALRQAQRWLRDTTNAEKAAYFRKDIPGPGETRSPSSATAELFSQMAIRNPDARDFSHPFFWGAFYLTGV